MHLLLIDGLNLIRRIHAAVPGEGYDSVSAAVDSSVHSLNRLFKQFQPSHAVCCFDGPELSWRHLEYTQYKAGRKPMPQELRDAMPGFREQFSHIGLASLALTTVEADDLAATLAVKMLSVGGRVTLVSTDKGFAQLLTQPEADQRLCLWDAFGRRQIDAESVKERFGLYPEKILDYWALTGDSTNNIKGVEGVGPKTALQLLSEHDSLEDIYQNLDGFSAKLSSKLKDNQEQAMLCRRLVTLATDMKLGCKLSDFRFVPPIV